MSEHSEAGERPQRIESDGLGSKPVPADAYYGIQTARAKENFTITGVPIRHHRSLIRALAMVKLAAAKANHDCGVLPETLLAPITRACEEIMAGALRQEFCIDVIQGGAGTSTNMNINEVIANRALEHMGHSKGDYTHCDPHDHVNASQSTNDVYPTALRLAILLSNEALVEQLDRLTRALHDKGEEFEDVRKIGRTQMQDAVPMTLGQEFKAWARSLEGEVNALNSVRKSLREVNMGGTAIGTGMNAPKGYAELCVGHLQRLTGQPFHLASDLVEATQDTQAFVQYSAMLKSLAIKLSKICNDLRLLSSGPRAGLNEINLRPVQAGSSIMPGKVNPVIPEVVNQVCFQAIGNDLTVTLAAEAGQLQLNVMEPVMVHAILETQTMFMNAARTLRDHCIVGITANRQVCAEYVERTFWTATALGRLIGYDRAEAVLAEAERSDRTILDVAREQELVTDAQIDKILALESLDS
ncbi:MAG: aspartate ammonia-lyase [Acidobacteriota bacterium]